MYVKVSNKLALPKKTTLSSNWRHVGVNVYEDRMIL